MSTPGVKEKVTMDSEVNLGSERAVHRSACVRLGLLGIGHT